MICPFLKSRIFWHYSILNFSVASFCSELLSSPRNGSEQHSESLRLFLFHGTEFPAFISSAEGFGTEFRDFLFRRTAGIPSEITICSVYSVFRGIIFLSEIPNPNTNCPFRRSIWNDDSKFCNLILNSSTTKYCIFSIPTLKVQFEIQTKNEYSIWRIIPSNGSIIQLKHSSVQ